MHPTVDFQLHAWQSPELGGLSFAEAGYRHHAFPPHFHDYYVIQYVVEGVCEGRCAGKNFAVPAGELILINPGEVHTGQSYQQRRLRYWSLYPSPESLHLLAGQLEINLSDSPVFNRSHIKDARLAQLLKQAFIQTKVDEGAGAGQEALLELFHGLLTDHAGQRMSTSRLPADDARVRRAANYLHDQLDQPFSLQSLSADVDLSPYHFLRLFKKQTGLSPLAYLQNIRVEEAKRLLSNGVSISEAAYQTGFADQSHLTRLFKRLTGITPGVYARL